MDKIDLRYSRLRNLFQRTFQNRLHALYRDWLDQLSGHRWRR
jgi:hypothetical protein